MPNSKQTLSHIDFESNFDKLVTQRVKGIWKTLQEASDNLYTCDQFLGDYNQLNHNRSMKDSCTQTDNSDSVVQLMCHLCEKLMNSVNDKEIITGDLLYSPQLMSKVEGSKQSRDSERHVSKFSEELSYSVFEQTELQNVIHQELKILKSLVQNLDEEVTSKDDLKYRIVKLLSYCEKISNIKIIFVFALVAYAAAAEPQPEEKKQPEKRGIYGAGYGYGLGLSGVGLGYSGLGYSGLGYSGLGYSGLGLGYSGLGYGYSGLGLHSAALPLAAAPIAAPIAHAYAAPIAAPIAHTYAAPLAHAYAPAIAPLGLGYSGLHSKLLLR